MSIQYKCDVCDSLLNGSYDPTFVTGGIPTYEMGREKPIINRDQAHVCSDCQKLLIEVIIEKLRPSKALTGLALMCDIRGDYSLEAMVAEARKEKPLVP